MDLMDWIKIALAVGLMSVGVQLYAAAPEQPAAVMVTVAGQPLR